jgi:hypothetical protein
MSDNIYPSRTGQSPNHVTAEKKFAKATTCPRAASCQQLVLVLMPISLHHDLTYNNLNT